MNEQKLNDFVGRALNDLGGAFSLGLVRIGATLGLYRALQAQGPMTPLELAQATGLHKLECGAWIADVGCGHGYSSVMMAEAFPNSEFIGFDFHAASINEARRHAQMHGVQDTVRFEVSAAKHYPVASDSLSPAYIIDCR
jgi:tRNA G46 methylase TrmB